jgi:hypothetical protein
MSVSAWGDSTSKRSNLQESVTIFWFRVLGRSLCALEGVWFRELRLYPNHGSRVPIVPIVCSAKLVVTVVEKKIIRPL